MKKSWIFGTLVVGILVIIGAYSYYSSQEIESMGVYNSPEGNNDAINEQVETQEERITQESKPVLVGFGVDIEPLNKQTNMAGDLIFTKKLIIDDGHISNDKVFIDFGDKPKYFEDSIGSIEYWFHLPLKTQVKAPISGKVNIVYFEHTEDWGVNINQEGSEYIVSFEHLVNIPLKEGDMVNAGDVVGEAAPRKSFNYDISMVELAVWKGGQGIVKFCPFDFLDENLKPIYSEKINTLASEWEDFIKKDVYKQEDWVSPGCLVEEIIEA